MQNLRQFIRLLLQESAVIPVELTGTKGKEKCKIISTGIRDANAEELAQMEVYTAQELAEKAQAEAKAAARESALAKLAALGLSAEEIAAL